MHRRNFLKGSSAAAFVAGTVAMAANAAKAADDANALAAPAIVPQRRTLRLVSLWPDAVTGPADHIHRLVRRIEAATDGHWTMEIDETTAGRTDPFKAVMTGDADVYLGHEHAHRELNPAFSYFAGLPCGTGMDIDHMNAWLMAAGGQELWDELTAQFNMKGLVIGHSVPIRGLVTRQPIRTRADFRGKRMAVTGLAADVLKAIDAIPVELDRPSLATLIEDTSLGGIELYDPTIALPGWQSARLNAIAPHHMLPGLSETGHAITLGLRRSFWDGLASSERIMLSALASEAFITSRADALALARARDQMSDAAIGTNDHKRPPHWNIVANELSRIAAAIVADLSGYDTHSSRINASYMAFKGHPHVPASV